MKPGNWQPLPIRSIAATVTTFLASRPSATFPRATADIGSLALVAAKVPVEDRFAISLVSRVLQLQRLEDGLSHKLAVGLFAHLLDRIPQRGVSGIAVIPLLSRLKFERFIPKARNQFFRSSATASVEAYSASSRSSCVRVRTLFE